MTTKKKSNSESIQEAMRKEGVRLDKEQKEAEKAIAKLPPISGTVVALQSFSTKRLTYVVGRKYKIGFNITEEEARGWLKSGYVEMINDLPEPSEVK